MNDRLRVASVTSNFHFGGDTNRLLAMSRCMDSRRFDHRVVVLVKPSAHRDAQAGTTLPLYQKHGVRVDVLSDEPVHERRTQRNKIARTLYHGTAFVRLVTQLVGYLRQHRIDVIDARNPHAIFVATAAARIARVPVVGTGYHPEMWVRTFGKAPSRAAYRSLDAFVTDSFSCLERFEQVLGAPKRGLVIRNGIYPPSSNSVPAQMRERFGLPADPNVFVFGQIARLTAIKGQRVLIAAAPTVIDQVPNAKFLICGFANRGPEYRAALESQIEGLGLRDQVKIVSYPGPVGDAWRAIDVHVHPTLYDSSPISLHESMALGKPTVTTQVGGVPELVVNEETGLIVPPDDPDALAAALLRVHDDKVLAERLGNAARKRYELLHQPETLARRYEAVFVSSARRSVISYDHGSEERISVNNSDLPSEHADAGTACIACGGVSGKSVGERAGHSLLRCACGGFYLSPSAEPDPDPVEHHPLPFYTLPAPMKLSWLARSHPGGSFLEVGCGEGHFLEQARQRGYAVAGIEADEERARAARTRLGVEIEHEFIEKSQWPEASCDVVYHCDLLSHFPDPSAALASMRRLVRPGGVLFFDVGLYQQPEFGLGGWTIANLDIPEHRWFYSEGALRGLLAQCGLGIVRMRRFSLAPQIVVSHVARNLGLISASGQKKLSSLNRAATRRDRYRNFMRFGIGGIVPKWGPLTSLVIAAPI